MEGSSQEEKKGRQDGRGEEEKTEKERMQNRRRHEEQRSQKCDVFWTGKRRERGGEGATQWPGSPITPTELTFSGSRFSGP